MSMKKQIRKSLLSVSVHHTMRTALFVVSVVIVIAIGSAAVSKGTSLNSMQISSQTGVIAFRDDCTGLLYAMHGDGTGRIAIPLPPKPEPASDYGYLQPLVLDVTTSGPLTVVYYVGIFDQVSHTLVDHGLFAVQLNDPGGVLTADPPERLSLPASVAVDPNTAVDPNFARFGSFSPAGSEDRLALAANDETHSVLMTAKVERDQTSLKITGLSDLVVVGDLYTIGLPDPGFPTQQGFTGTLDYSPDGTSIVASIYYDLWRIYLGTDHKSIGSERLTQNTDGFAEWNPAFSPDGSRIAYTSGAIVTSGGVQKPDIYTLDLASRAVVQVTSNMNKGDAGSLRNNAIWSPDSAWIGFTAYTSRSPRHSPCSYLVNSEIFSSRPMAQLERPRLRIPSERVSKSGPAGVGSSSVGLVVFRQFLDRVPNRMAESTGVQ
jgi:hypothetical protein